MRVLLDTNIIIDYLSKRPQFYANARMIIKLCVEKRIDGYVAAHSILNIFYILRKEFTAEERRSSLFDLCKVLTVIGIDKEKIITVLCNSDFSDLEDCLQAECAKNCAVDYIITRNIKDFHNSAIPAIMPDVFLKEFED